MLPKLLYTLRWKGNSVSENLGFFILGAVCMMVVVSYLLIRED